MAWWFGWSPSELDKLTLSEVERWLDQAKRQIDARYSKAAF